MPQALAWDRMAPDALAPPIEDDQNWHLTAPNPFITEKPVVNRYRWDLLLLLPDCLAVWLRLSPTPHAGTAPRTKRQMADVVILHHLRGRADGSPQGSGCCVLFRPLFWLGAPFFKVGLSAGLLF